MAPEKKVYSVEMDYHGRPIHVRRRRNSGGGYRLTDAELLNIAEEESRVLRAERDNLLRRLSQVEAREYSIQNSYRVLANEHSTCRETIRELQQRLENQRARSDELKQEIRLLRRTSLPVESYRQRYEEALREIDLRDQLVRIEETRVVERDTKIAGLINTIDKRERTIFHMKALLRQLGYRYEE